MKQLIYYQLLVILDNENIKINNIVNNKVFNYELLSACFVLRSVSSKLNLKVLARTTYSFLTF